MTEQAAVPVPFEEDPPRADVADGSHEVDALLLNIDGYEGPIDILLKMAQDQKVDLTKISILQLARQYMAFIDRAKELELELAAEYLVMAAWLAYLKSRLLLPREKTGDGPDAQAMADALQFQLRRLEAMRKASHDLFNLPRLGQNIFARGMAEGLKTVQNPVWDVKLYDLLKTYGDICLRREGTRGYELPTFHLMSMEVALERVTRMLGNLPRNGPWSAWTTLQSFMPQTIKDALFAKSSMASIFTAGLELAKQGKVELRQDGLFRPIYLRAAVARTDEQVSSDIQDNNQNNSQDQEVVHDTGTQ